MKPTPRCEQLIPPVWLVAVFALASLFLLVAGCAAGPPTNSPASALTAAPGTETALTSGPDQTPSSTAVPTTTAAPARRWPLTIAAVGDIMLARGVASAITPDEPDGPFAAVRGRLQAADLTVGNVESVVSELGTPEPKAYTFAAPPLAAMGLALAGFDVVSLANNHSLDFGTDALLDTVDTLKAASVGVVGAGRNDREAWASHTVTVNGLRVAFLAAAEVPNEAAYDMRAWAATEDEAGISWVDDARLAAAVRSGAADADLVIVLLHFGIEGTIQPSDRQRQVARAAVDAGASLVIGSHPHLVQPVEEYHGGLIAYSLGNFVFDGFEGPANDSGILFATFVADGSVTWRIEPVTIGWDGLPRPN
ncbi:MAG: CapA family protein [Dehalococcoidia bacterium]|nr:CapA family protein [Dehalococcoidia bacterium]